MISKKKMYNKIIEKSIKKSLFEPYKLGDLLLKNRIIMSSLSRGKADPKTLVPTEIMVQKIFFKKYPRN